MQITIQKKYLILIEISENVFRVFLVIVNFVFNFIEERVNIFEEEVKNVWSNFVYKTFNFILALFGFNIYKLELIQIKTKTNEIKNIFKNNDFLIYSNLLAPPKNYF